MSKFEDLYIFTLVKHLVLIVASFSPEDGEGYGLHNFQSRPIWENHAIGILGYSITVRKHVVDSANFF